MNPLDLVGGLIAALIFGLVLGFLFFVISESRS